MIAPTPALPQPVPPSDARAARMSPAPTGDDARLGALRTQAQALEAAFLSEMLGHAGLGAPAQSSGPGGSEDPFASFLRQAHAEALVARGGIGLAEHLFNALKVRLDTSGQ
jgi:flagellar protein FlgJ